MINFFSDSTGLYFFSALLQADAAILAITGIFIIFRIQSIQNKIDSIENFIVTKHGIGGINALDTYHRRPVESQKDYQSMLYSEDRFFAFIYKYETEISIMKKVNRLPAFLLFIGLIINIVGLIIANIIHYIFILEYLIISLNSVYHFFCFWVVVYSIINLMEGETSDSWTKEQDKFWRILKPIYLKLKLPTIN